MAQRDDRCNRRSRQPDPPVDVMPDYENQNLVWLARTLPTRTDFKAASMLSLARKMALGP